MLLKSKVPKEWYQSASKKNHDKGASGPIRGSMANALLDVDILDSVLDSGVSGSVGGSLNEKDPRVMNTRYFRHLLSQIPTVLTPTLQGAFLLSFEPSGVR